MEKQNGSCFTAYLERLNQFDAIVKNYNDALALVASKKTYSNCFIWLPYQDQWYVAKASWVAFKDAKANYLWSNVAGTGSIGLSFEQVLEKPKRQTDCNRTL
jgi:iron complex transport system substrate-binding protein